jgi:hypothetical protein
MTAYSLQLKKRVKAVYGPWLLVQLPSGRWAAVWHHFIDDMDREAKVILEEINWFYTKLDERDWCRRSPSFTKRSDALDKIRMDLEATHREDGKSYDDYYLPILKTIRIAIKRSQTKEAKEESGCPLVRELTIPTYRSLLLQ